MKNSQYILHKGDIFTQRLIKRNKLDLIWQVEFNDDGTVLGTIEKTADGEYSLYWEKVEIGLSIEWMQELSKFLQLVNKEQLI